MSGSWKKGLTKETDERVARNAESIKNGFRNGRVVWNKGLKGVQVPWNKGLTKETDIRLLEFSKNPNLKTSKKGRIIN